MKINYNGISLSDNQLELLAETIYKNPYIPVEPYKQQLYAIADTNKRKLIGGSAYSGKSILGAMLALQYMDVPNYRALVIRKTYDDVTATGGVVDYIDQWTKHFDHIEHNQSKRVFHNILTNAKIFYNYAFHENDRFKFKSRAYHRIIVDEASELFKVILTFFNRSIRPNDQKNIPLGLYYITNPANTDSVEYLIDNFVEDKGKYPYYEMNYWDNPNVDADDYAETISELDKIDFEYQSGNWYYKPQKGDLFDRDVMKSHEVIKYKSKVKRIYNVISIDLAGSGVDETAICSLSQMEDGIKYLEDIDSTSSENPETMIHDFILNLNPLDQPVVTDLIILEKEGGSAIFNYKYWRAELEEFIRRGISFTDKKPVLSKYQRARPASRAINNNGVKFRSGINLLESFYDECVGLDPNTNKTSENGKKLKSPNLLDSFTQAFNYLDLKFKGKTKGKKTYRRRR